MHNHKQLLNDVPNPGWRLYPAAVCLQTVLDARQDHYPIHFLENVSGHPYGWFYLNTLIHGAGRAVCMTPGTELTNSVKVALDNLGYSFQHYLSDDWETTWTRIQEHMRDGEPLIFGPLAYSALKYQRSAWRSPPEASHYVVVVGYDADHIYFHDPNGYSFIPFPIETFKAACTDEVMIPSTALYSFIVVGERIARPSPRQIIARVLEAGVQSYADQTVRTYGYRGIRALQHYADDLGTCLGADDLDTRRLLFSKMAYYFYPKGNQTRADAAVFMRYATQIWPELTEPLTHFAEAFLQAAIQYGAGSEIATRVMVDFSAEQVTSHIQPLQAVTYRILEHEREGREYLTVAHETMRRVEFEGQAVPV